MKLQVVGAAGAVALAACAVFLTLRPDADTRTQPVEGGSRIYWRNLLTYPRMDFDYVAYERARLRKEAMAERMEGPAAVDWTNIGPKNLDPKQRQYFGLKPNTGRVNAIAVDPKNPKRIWVGSPSGGLWLSEDEGATWKPMSDNWLVNTISCIAINPKNPNEIYVGTGDFRNSSQRFARGVRKTTNGGATWTTYLSTETANQHISAILIDPEDPKNIVVFSSAYDTYWDGAEDITGKGKAFWSGDGLENVTEIASLKGKPFDWTSASIGAFNNATGRRVYYCAGQGKDQGGLFRSMDKGKTWTALDYGGTGWANGKYLNIALVAASPNNPYTVYCVFGRAAKETTTDYTRNRLVVSQKAGMTGSWTQLDASLGFGTDTYDGTNESRRYQWEQANYDRFLLVGKRPRPSKPDYDVVYFGLLTTLEYDADTGKFADITRSFYADSKFHNDQQSIALHPTDKSTIYIGGDGGLVRGKYAAGTWTLTSLSGGNDKYLGIIEHYSGDWSHDTHGYAIGGTQDNGTPLNVDKAGKLSVDDWQDVSAGDGGYSTIDPKDFKRQATSYHGSPDVLLTDDAWKTQQANTPTWGVAMFHAPLEFDDNDSKWLYSLSNVSHQLDTSKLGNVWSDGAKIVTGRYGTAIAARTTAADNAIIVTGALDGQVWRCKGDPKKAASWHRIDTSDLQALPGLPVTSVAIHPTNPKIVYVTLGGTPHRNVPPGSTERVWRCDDADETDVAKRKWVKASSEFFNLIPALSIALDPDDPSKKLYVGTDDGIYYSNNGGASWTDIGYLKGIPAVPVTSVEVVKSEKRLYIATYGRGMYWRKWPID